jgi:hypothetical protein
MKVLFSLEVRAYFDKLETDLYEKGYFSYEDSSHKYADDLFFDIRDTLPHRQHRPAPPYFDKYGKGMYYATFRKNRQTVWYAFFTKYTAGGDTVYLVRHIDNNHIVAQHM